MCKWIELGLIRICQFRINKFCSFILKYFLLKDLKTCILCIILVSGAPLFRPTPSMAASQIPLMIIISRGAEGPGREILQRPPSVRLSVRPSVRLSVCPSRLVFSKLCRYVHQVMGVCCIVFDIDGMLFEFFKYWKNQIFFFLSIFQVCFAFHAISNIKKKNWCKKKKSGGGGGGCGFFYIFFIRQNNFWFHFLCYFQH